MTSKSIRAGILAGIWLLIGSAAIVHAQQPNHPFGVAEQADYENVQSVGAKYMRQGEAVWSIQPSETTWTWTWDAKLDLAEARGLQFSPVIALGQCWMTGHPVPLLNPSYPPADLSTTYDPVFAYSEDFYNFIYALAERYIGRVDHFTIEGEANASNWWAGTIDEYLRTLKTATKAANDANPDLVIFDSGVASAAWGAAIARERYESPMYSDADVLAFANEYFDRNVYFPVAFATIEELTDWLYSPFVADQYDRLIGLLAGLNGACDAFNFRFTEYYWLYDDVVDWIQEKMTEHGYAFDFWCNNEASLWPGVSEEQLGKELMQQYVVGFGLGVDRTLWFPFYSNVGGTPRVGLLTEEGDMRETGIAYQYAARVIGDQFGYTHNDSSEANVFQFVFDHRKNPLHHLRVCWYDDGTHTPGSQLVTFDLPTGTTTVILSDYAGHRSVADVLGQTQIAITITEDPVYLEYFQDASIITGVPADETPTLLLGRNYPNPFRPTTTMNYHVPGEIGESRMVRLSVFDVEGRLMRSLVDREQYTGVYTARWHGDTDGGAAAPPGVYFYRYEVGDQLETRKMILAP